MLCIAQLCRKLFRRINIHKFIIIPLVFLLGGCWHANDPRPVMVNADVSTNAGKLCVKAPDVSDDEYILYVCFF